MSSLLLGAVLMLAGFALTISIFVLATITAQEVRR